MITSDRVLYVSVYGSDANDCSSLALACRTWQRPIDIATDWDIPNGKSVTIQIGDGVYREQAVLKTITGGGKIVLQGNALNHNLVTLAVHGKDAIYPHSDGARGLYEFRHFRITTTGAGNAILIENAGMEVWVYDINFDHCAEGHILVSNFAMLRIRGDYTISGDAPYHFRAIHMGRITANNKSITLRGKPVFREGFAFQEDGGRISLKGNTYRGTATGKKWFAEDDGHISAGKESNTIPGSVYGTGKLK